MTTAAENPPRRAHGARFRATLLGLALLLLVVALLSLSFGAAQISLQKALTLVLLEPFGLGASGASEAERVVVLSLRAPRIVLGALVGAALGSSGAAVQGLFRNPLAEPGLIGVSAGAALGAALAIVVGGAALAALPPVARPALLPLAAFAGGLGATALVLRLGARLGGRASVLTVLLAGVALNAFVGSVVGLLATVASDAELRSLVFFTMGGLASSSWTQVVGTLPFVLVALIGLPRLARSLDLLSLGEREASYLGVEVKRLERQVVILVAVAVGAAVAASGLIGFVGLVVPHLVRLRVGASQRLLIPLSGLLGASMLVASDALARVVASPAELPVGMITALVGAPFFLWLLARETHRS